MQHQVKILMFNFVMYKGQQLCQTINDYQMRCSKIDRVKIYVVFPDKKKNRQCYFSKKKI